MKKKTQAVGCPLRRYLKLPMAAQAWGSLSPSRCRGRDHHLNFPDVRSGEPSFLHRRVETVKEELVTITTTSSRRHRHRGAPRSKPCRRRTSKTTGTSATTSVGPSCRRRSSTQEGEVSSNSSMSRTSCVSTKVEDNPLNGPGRASLHSVAPFNKLVTGHTIIIITLN